MNGGPSGFHNAPVTRTLVIACALLTILIGIQSRSTSFGLSYQDVFRNIQLWRFIASLFAFSSTPELMFGLYLLYYFRVFERQIGSNKYSVFVLFSLIITSLFEVLALALLLRDRTSSLLASGPYGLIFASFIPFYFDIPVTTRFHVFGFHFSDKSFIYLAGLQLLLSSWKRSILPGLCGVLAGSLYRINVFGIRRLKLPQFITSSFSRLSRSSSSSSSSTTSSRNILGNVPSFMGRQPERNRPTFAPPASVAEPPEDSIALLVSMGFNRNSAREALMRARNDINVASNILLETQSH